jgi:S1-C subfamily serine protease
MSYDDYGEQTRASWLRSPFVSLAVALLAIVVATMSFVRQQSALDAANVAQLHAKRVERELRFVHEDNDQLAGRLRSTERELHVTPIAARALKSVFTVSAGGRIGTAFVGWRDVDGTYLITAAHVVEGFDGTVELSRKGDDWTGEVVRRDKKNDLALIRVEGRPDGAPPLWQKPRATRPKTGEQLLLVGSPYGLGGTVTTGIVSRVTRRMVQTDAAANPGNSGGPAVNRRGQVVGVLLAGGGENINFAVRIERVCRVLRRC